MANIIGIEYLPLTIGAGTSLSPAIGLGAKTLHGIIIPSGWTTAVLTFLDSPDGVNFYPMSDVNGVGIQYTVAAGTHTVCDPLLWRSVNNIQIRSGTIGTPVNQVSAMTLQLVVRPIL